MNEIPPEKPGVKRVNSRGSAGVQSNAEPVENDWMTEEYLAALDQQKVILFLSIHQAHPYVYFRWN